MLDAAELLQNGDIEIVFEDESQADGDDAGETETEAGTAGEAGGEAIAGRRQSEFLIRSKCSADHVQMRCAYCRTSYRAEMAYNAYFTVATTG